eukprot:CAMPEP_0113725926 /NCGR_PEP_ID=MMETSP0038_2-20120614/40089_1 /TAXON_ID=2898 /ORGANISM="Cryptomonas paramecium" /LENGTH=121 /DNA_ID=CAMNT_0000656359 /DNA_START=256 /DNA_END=618 /DNA_ORIENTATION=- /assembly_acc=CAM_ASM_000170
MIEYGKETFSVLAAGVLSEQKLHEAYAKKWDVDLSLANPSPATLEYVNFLAETTEAQSRSPDGKISVICAAMVPCMRLYAFLGKSLSQAGFGSGSAAGPYHEWVDTYSAADFEELAASLEA